MVNSMAVRLFQIALISLLMFVCLAEPKSRRSPIAPEDGREPIIVLVHSAGIPGAGGKHTKVMTEDGRTVFEGVVGPNDLVEIRFGRGGRVIFHGSGVSLFNVGVNMINGLYMINGVWSSSNVIQRQMTPEEHQRLQDELDQLARQRQRQAEQLQEQLRRAAEQRQREFDRAARERHRQAELLRKQLQRAAEERERQFQAFRRQMDQFQRDLQRQFGQWGR